MTAGNCGTFGGLEVSLCIAVHVKSYGVAFPKGELQNFDDKSSEVSNLFVRSLTARMHVEVGLHCGRQNFGSCKATCIIYNMGTCITGILWTVPMWATRSVTVHRLNARRKKVPAGAQETT